MPDYWQFPTVSMGLGPINAIYQAMFNRYADDRGITDTKQQQVWAFLGDGEMDEVESRGALQFAAGAELDNLTFVVNCNLQRLDGPVRGNGKIVQELESYFRGAGWNVIKVIWGRDWDPLLAADADGALVNLMNTTPDGDFQTFKAESGAFIREHFFGRDTRTKTLAQHLSDDDIWALRRGGHDDRKIYAAYKAAMEHEGQPTVILAHTVKGYRLGSTFEGRNATHQMKKLSLDDLKGFRDALDMPVTDEQLEASPYLPPYIKPQEGSAEHEYLQERRKALGGSIPSRKNTVIPLNLPGDDAYKSARRGSGKQKAATTMSLVRLLKDLMRDKETGKRWVPIIPDEARTFGMDAMFPTAKIWSPQGQQYLSVDRDLFLSYKESEQGQLLHVGINEAGSMAAFTAAGTAGDTLGEPMIPFYIFYSMFGFQRTADAIWAATDQLANGFLIGATAGRTTLNGEGLQHEDGHSLLMAHTNPAVRLLRPGVRLRDRAHGPGRPASRMYGEGEHVFYYITVYNEPIVQPAEPENVDVEGILKGIHRIQAAEGAGPRVQLLASGSGMSVGAEGRGAPVRGLGRARRPLVGDLVVRAQPRRRRGRAAQPAPPRGREARPIRDAASSRAPTGRSSPSATTCGPCRTSSAAGCRATTPRWARTASATPTPAGRCAATSTSTPSRSPWPPSSSSPPAARSSRSWPRRRRRSTRSPTRPPQTPAKRAATPRRPTLKGRKRSACGPSAWRRAGTRCAPARSSSSCLRRSSRAAGRLGRDPRPLRLLPSRSRRARRPCRVPSPCR